MAKKTGAKIQEQQTPSANGNSGNGNSGGNGETKEMVGSLELSTEEIAARAFQIYERQGRLEGRDLENWLQAENELRAERQARPTQTQAALPRSARLRQGESAAA